MNTSTENRLDKYREPIVWPKEVKEKATEGWGLISSITLLVVVAISLFWIVNIAGQHYAENATFASVGNGQFSLTVLPINTAALNITATVVSIIALAIGLLSIRTEALYWLTTLLGVIILLFAIFTPLAASSNEHSLDAFLPHLSEEAGIEFTSSSYNSENGIYTISDGTTAYNFLVSEGGTADGKETLFLTAQQ